MIRVTVAAADTDESYWSIIKSSLFRTLINFPFIKGYADKELDKTVCIPRS